MALIIDVKVVPSSGRNSCTLDSTGKLKWYLVAAPEKGKANQELVDSIAKLLHISKQDVEIISGQISKYKKVKIHCAMTMNQLLEKLGLASQMKIT